MPRRRKLTSPLALAVLSVLITGPMHPYQIARVLKHRGKDESIKIRYGSLYTVVDDLENRGFVAAEGTARAGNRPERTVYRLTADGRQELEDRLRELLSEPVKEYPLFASALSLVTVLDPDEAARLLAERLGQLDMEIAASRAALGELVTGQRLPRLFVLESEYALALKQAEADWVRGTVRELADGSLPYVKEWRTFHETGEFPAELLDTSWARAEQALWPGPAPGETTREADEPD